MKKIAIIGTQGVPANYGGFESLVENIIGDNQSNDLKYTIFCSSKDMPDHRPHYKGCTLKYIPLHANGAQSIPYDMVAMLKCVRGYDALLILGTSGCLLLPALRLLGVKHIVVNIDGLEHRRAKWGKVARTILRWSEASAVRWADSIIADNQGIVDYVTETYGKESVLIAYGGDHVHRDISAEKQDEILKGYGLARGEYAVTVCRIEPENNCHVTLEAFAASGRQLVFIGNWHHSEYAERLYQQYNKAQNMTLLNNVYDLDMLYCLRSNAGWYVHGHSAGGTNPSLVEAMHFGMPILAYDVSYNRYTTHGMAYYFKSADELSALLRRDDLDGAPMRELAQKHYTWRKIAKDYERVLKRSFSDK